MSVTGRNNVVIRMMGRLLYFWIERRKEGKDSERDSEIGMSGEKKRENGMNMREKRRREV